MVKLLALHIHVCVIVLCVGSLSVRGEEVCRPNDLRAVVVMLRQMKTDIHDLKEESSHLKRKIKALETKNEALNPPLVAFIARKPINTNPASGEILIFQNEELDTRDAYDITSGKFTAPFAGAYLFSVQMCVKVGSGIFYQIRSSLSEKSHIKSFHGGDIKYGECSSAITMARLAQHEEVWVESGSTGNSNEIHINEMAWNMFTGILVSPSIP